MTTKRTLDEGETGQAKRQVVEPVLLCITHFSIDTRFVLERDPEWFPDIFDAVIAWLKQGRGRSFLSARDQDIEVKKIRAYLAALIFGDEYLVERDYDDDDDDDLHVLDLDARRKRIQELLDSGKYDEFYFIGCSIIPRQPFKTTGQCYHVALSQ
jgi:hypothetical protein